MLFPAANPFPEQRSILVKPNEKSIFKFNITDKNITMLGHNNICNLTAAPIFQILVSTRESGR